MKKHFQRSQKLQKKCHFQKMTNRLHLKLLPIRRHHQTLHWKLYLQNCTLPNWSAFWRLCCVRYLSQLVPSKMYWTTFCAEKNLLVLPKLLKITLNIINVLNIVFTYCLTWNFKLYTIILKLKISMYGFFL
jgi:hypothetical protein